VKSIGVRLGKFPGSLTRRVTKGPNHLRCPVILVVRLARLNACVFAHDAQPPDPTASMQISPGVYCSDEKAVRLVPSVYNCLNSFGLPFGSMHPFIHLIGRDKGVDPVSPRSFGALNRHRVDQVSHDRVIYGVSDKDDGES
jgi:hypothetical protein